MSVECHSDWLVLVSFFFFLFSLSLSLSLSTLLLLSSVSLSKVSPSRQFDHPIESIVSLFLLLFGDQVWTGVAWRVGWQWVRRFLAELKAWAVEKAVTHRWEERNHPILGMRCHTILQNLRGWKLCSTCRPHPGINDESLALFGM